MGNCEGVTTELQINVESGAREAVTNIMCSRNNCYARVSHTEVEAETHGMYPC